MTSPADPELLRQVLEAEGIEPHAAEPSRWGWFVDRLTTGLGNFGDRLEGVPGMGELVWTIAAALAAVLAALVILAIWRLVRAWQGRTRRAEVDEAPIVARPVPPPADRHRAEAEAALAAGRPRDAVRAAWAWVAWTLHARAVARYEPDLTNREFVERVRSERPGWRPLPGLRAFARKVDLVCYDAAEPAVDDARQVLTLAERTLAEDGGAHP